ncbi:MAG: hypothetical protein EBR79_01805 [Proteobacteria bacterium]|nr:hypothetical protein [Pseudomonadota bacterium]NBX86159.1 hypothetical protein [Pseudomonadota bacterium]
MIYQATHAGPRNLADGYLAMTEQLAGVCLDVGEHPSDEAAYVYTWFVPDALRAELVALVGQKLAFVAVDESVDYVALTRANFPPLRIGGFYITRNDEEIPAGLCGLAVAPNRAFGSGEHATTTGCLLGYEWLVAQGLTFERGLDFGAGSGLLAIAAAKRDVVPFVCIDNDPPSVEICAENAALNGVSGLIESRLGEVPPQDIYPLVFANILLQPLLDLCDGLVACLDKKAGSALILSGFTVGQAPLIAAAYGAKGLRMAWQHSEKEWVAQVWMR